MPIRSKRHDRIDGNRVLVDNESASPLWARFYEIGSDGPIFCNRDGVIGYDYQEIDPGRRNAYLWVGGWGEALLEKDYPAWRQKHAAI